VDTEKIFLILFIVATAVAVGARRLRVPYTVALVIAGLLLGMTRAFTPPHLTKGLLYSLFLPGLLFEAAFHLESSRFWANKLTILGLAVPGVVGAMAVATVLLVPAVHAFAFVERFNYSHGLVFAAAIAATDPIAVTAMFKSLGAPRRLTVLLEGESLLNDGTAAVLFSLMLAVSLGEHTSPLAGIVEFVRVVGLGALIGGAIGFAISKIVQQVHEPLIEITLTTIAAYGSFIAAEGAQASGVISTVVTGMLCGNYAAHTGMRPSTRIAVESFWEYVAFALNSIVFLLIGFEVHLTGLISSWKPILVAYAAVTISRAFVISLATGLLRRTRERLPWSWGAVLTWGGLRGGLSMVLVLGLPPSFPQRDLLITMTFGVVVLSILVQGLTMGGLLRRLGLADVKQARLAYEIYRGSLGASQAVLRALERFGRDKLASNGVLDALRQQYLQEVEVAQAGIRQLHLQQGQLQEEERHHVETQLLAIAKQQLIESFHEGLIGRAAFEHLVSDWDARILRLESLGQGDEHVAESAPSSDRAR
jgi:CPA1 family monovalent cation:H+ antiporter